MSISNKERFIKGLQNKGGFSVNIKVLTKELGLETTAFLGFIMDQASLYESYGNSNFYLSISTVEDMTGMKVTKQNKHIKKLMEYGVINKWIGPNSSRYFDVYWDKLEERVNEVHERLYSSADRRTEPAPIVEPIVEEVIVEEVIEPTPIVEEVIEPATEPEIKLVEYTKQFGFKKNFANKETKDKWNELTNQQREEYIAAAKFYVEDYIASGDDKKFMKNCNAVYELIADGSIIDDSTPEISYEVSTPDYNPMF